MHEIFVKYSIQQMFSFSFLDVGLVLSTSKTSRIEALNQQDVSKSVTQMFFERTASMPLIWENILSNLSGSDVAHCLRSCKSFRSIIGSWMMFSKKFRNQMDSSAIVSAIEKRKIKYTEEIRLDHKMDDAGLIYLYAIDDLLFTRKRNSTDIEIVKSITGHCDGIAKNETLEMEQGDADFFEPGPFAVYPTQDVERFFVRDMWGQCKLATKDALTISIFQRRSSPRSGELVDVRSQDEVYLKPYCPRYRLFQQENFFCDHEYSIALLNSMGLVTKIIPMKDPEFKVDWRTRHLASNEQVI